MSTPIERSHGAVAPRSGPPGRRPTAAVRFLALALLGTGCAHLDVEPEPIRYADAPLTVDDAVALALHNHPDVRIARQLLLQSAAAVEDAESMFWPDVSVGASFSRTDAPSRVFAQLLDQGEFTPGIDFNDPGTRSDFRPEIRGGVTLYDGGRRRARLSRSEARLGARVAFEEEVRAMVAFEAASAWYRLHAARASAALAAREVPLLEQRVSAAEAERDSGAALPLSVQAQQVQLAGARQAALSADTAAKHARATLVLLLGLGVEVDIELREPDAFQSEALEPLGMLLERARFLRPELLRSQREIEAALATLRESEAGYLPQLRVDAAFGSNDESARLAHSNWLFGIGLVESLTEVLRTPYRIRRATAALLAAHEAGRRSLLAVEGEVQAAWLDAQEAQRTLELVRTERGHADAHLRRVEAEYDVGAALTVTRSSARLAADRAATRERIAELRCTQTRLALEHAVGTFPARREGTEDETP